MNFIAYDGGCFNPKEVVAVYIDDDNNEHSIVSLANGDRIFLEKPIVYTAKFIAAVANGNDGVVIDMLRDCKDDGDGDQE